MAVKFGFKIDEDLWRAMRKNVRRLSKELSRERLAIEAYILSKYPQAREYMDTLGIEYMEEESLVEMGEKESEG